MSAVRIIDGDGTTTVWESVLGEGIHPSARADISIVAASHAMRHCVELARKFAALELPILLIGATGTGKEVLAQAIHRWSGRPGALVDVNCGAIAPGVAASLFFGHRRGAYTGAVETTSGLFQEAQDGTLFLDELPSLVPEGQTSLLRALETGEVRRVGGPGKRQVSVGLVAATQPADAVPGGSSLRPDLYQRLAGLVIRLPILAARIEDIWPLARCFAAGAGRVLAPAARPLLEEYPWPGNVRELRLCIQRAVALAEASLVDSDVIDRALYGLTCHEDLPASRGRCTSAPIAEERILLESLAREHNGRASAMAMALRVSRATLYRRLQRVGLRLRYRLEENLEVSGDCENSQAQPRNLNSPVIT